MIAGEAEDDELVPVRGFDFLVKGFEAFELRGEAAFRGCVDDEDDFVFELGQVVGLVFLYCAEGGEGVSACYWTAGRRGVADGWVVRVDQHVGRMGEKEDL